MSRFLSQPVPRSVAFLKQLGIDYSSFKAQLMIDLSLIQGELCIRAIDFLRTIALTNETNKFQLHDKYLYLICLAYALTKAGVIKKQGIYEKIAGTQIPPNNLHVDGVFTVHYNEIDCMLFPEKYKKPGPGIIEAGWDFIETAIDTVSTAASTAKKGVDRRIEASIQSLLFPQSPKPESESASNKQGARHN